MQGLLYFHTTSREDSKNQKWILRVPLYFVTQWQFKMYGFIHIEYCAKIFQR